MNAPALNRPLVLEAPQDVADGAGGFDRLWLPLGTHWASVKFGAGSERARGAATVSKTSVRIVVRSYPQGSPGRPTAQQRFREGTRVYHIESVREADETGRYLECRAIEEVVV